ncbi:MAG TPA: Trk system potassium transporter TrkA [Candidatus Hydrogenedentes bacterium]|nr:Trk system potassium transporter TrkA [Candidatus Hydrogenedentota bacterium]
MNIFVAGGGRIGFHLATLLSKENHDVTVIEWDTEQLDELDASLDVSTVEGDAASVMLLTEAGVKSAELFVAATGSDEVNLLSAAAAKSLGAKRAVARVHKAPYLETAMLYEQTLDIDFVLSPEAITALDIANYIESPGIVASEDFGRGLVQMRQIRVLESPTRDGKTLKDVCPPGSGVLLGAISRRSQTLIPHGDTIVEPGDLVTLVGKREKMEAVQKLFHGADSQPRSVVIMGGGSIGLHLAQVLEQRLRSVKLFDKNSAYCCHLSEQLMKTDVIARDVTSRTVIEEESVAAADLFVATTRDDERNIMASVLAKEMGVDHTVTVVHQPDFAPLVWKLGIDHAVTPRTCFANRVLKLVRQEQVSSAAVLEEGEVEILEVHVKDKMPIAGKPLREVQSRFPRQALVATIQRGDDVIVPSGNDAMLVGDCVVIITTSDAVEAVRKLFKR